MNTGNSALSEDSSSQRSPDMSARATPGLPIEWHKAAIHEDMGGSLSRKMHNMRMAGEPEDSPKLQSMANRRGRLWDMASKVHGEE